jgi:small subunit ribosomal protein S17
MSSNANENENQSQSVNVDSDETLNGRSMTGKVISNKPVGGKTITVEVERRVMHAKYKKIVRRRSKYRAHDENNICQINDEVVIQECRPLSKTKRWKVIEHTSAKH